MRIKDNKMRNLIVVIMIVLVTNALTAGAVMFSKPVAKQKIDTNSKIQTVKSILKENYVDKIDATVEAKMAEGQIKGMVDSIGDPYTVYMSAKDYKDFNRQMQGSYAGIGVYIGDKAGRITVTAPIEDSPAEKLGVKPGDAIIAVNGITVASKDMDKAVSMMLGKPGTDVKVTFYREGKGTFTKNITRAKIIIKSIKYEMLNNKIGYIKMSMFDESTSDEFNKAFTDLESKGQKGLIIDLRDNGGGLLSESWKIADKLLGKGTIVYTIDNKGEKEVWSSDSSKFDKPLVLLVNGGTASASEILSGAVRDFKAGTLIGTKTFGKGLVQIPVPLDDGSAVKVTIARYYTPSGECIQKKGITPNIVVELTKQEKEKYNNGEELKHSEDNQLQKGIEIIKSKF
jgi:carboxyl-terminal processing protease